MPEDVALAESPSAQDEALSSAEDTTPEAPAASDSADGAPPSLTGAEAQTDAAERGPIPYDRFQEVVHARQAAEAELTRLRAFEPLVTEFEKNNLRDADSVFNWLQQQQAQQQQQTEYQTRARQIEQDLLSRVQTGELSQEVAQTIYNERVEALSGVLLGQQAQQVLQASQQMTAERELEAARKSYPEMDELFVRELHKATGTPIALLAKQSHDALVARDQRIKAEYTAQLAAQRKAPPPEGARGQSPGLVDSLPDPSDPAFLDQWNKAKAKAGMTRAGYG